ncbi:MAG: type II toxin-antitoxin system RelE/ParE family toxin [Leptolyngbyaceae cyanobacterium]
MPTPPVKWSVPALNDFRRQIAYYDDPTRANEAAAAIDKAIRTISKMPQIGVKVRDPSTREYQVRFGRGALIVRYSIQASVILILHIYHNSQQR